MYLHMSISACMRILGTCIQYWCELDLTLVPAEKLVHMDQHLANIWTWAARQIIVKLLDLWSQIKARY